MEEFDVAAETQSESPFAPPQTPRLSILHLMLWTLCSAVYLSLMRAIYALQGGDLPSGYAEIQNASSVIQGMLTGAVLTGAIVLVRTRFRLGPPMLRQPGHWLLFVSAIFNLIYLPLIASLLLLQDFDFGGTSFMLSYGAIYLLPTIAYGFAARRISIARWKTIFIAMAAVNLVQCIFYIAIGVADNRIGSWVWMFSAIQSLGSLLLPLAVLVVSIVDLVAARRYDWLHWTGVTTHVAGSSVTLLWMIGSWFVR